jgi:hypothetical protein
LKVGKLTHGINWFCAVGMLLMYVFESFVIEIKGLPVVGIDVCSRFRTEIKDLELVL